MEQEIILVAALTENRVIGKDNGLPWNLPDDWSRLQHILKGRDVVMGRKVYESDESLLTEGKNYILSTQDSLDLPEKALQFKNLDNFYENTSGQIFCLGGGEIYKQMIDHSDRMMLTHIHTEMEGDTYFPEFDLDEWEIVEEQYHPMDEHHAYDFTYRDYKRIKS